MGKHDEYIHTGISKEDNGRAQIGEATSNYPNDSKYQQTCYRCGDPGHIMRNCPKGHASERKYNRLDSGQNYKTDKRHRVEDGCSKFEYSSSERLRSSRDALSSRKQRNERKVFSSRHQQMPSNDELSPVAKEIDKPLRKKCSSKEIESPDRSKAKKARKSISSSLHHDYTETRSGSMSWSSKSLPRSSSRSSSRPVSSRAHSLSSSLRSSESHPSAAQSPNSRRSISPTSLSLSLDLPILSSGNKDQLNSKGSSINAALDSLDHLGVQGQQSGSNLKLLNDESKDTSIAVNGDAAMCTRVLEGDQYVQEVNADKGTFTAGNFSSDRSKDVEGFQQSGTVVMNDVPAEIWKPAAETPISHHSDLLATSSSEEMCKVLKHYGLDLPDEDEKNLTADALFGSARLWPWHIIYYRRLKKGPISTENYVRRVAQNQEFGIVDKYIRSSSGWGELNPENS